MEEVNTTWDCFVFIDTYAGFPEGLGSLSHIQTKTFYWLQILTSKNLSFPYGFSHLSKADIAFHINIFWNEKESEKSSLLPAFNNIYNILAAL